MRICSLLPGATEIAFALGLGEELVGVTHECDYPPEARHKPVVVRTSIDSHRMTSLEIDRAVSERVRNNQSLYTIDETRLREAAPDIILTQGLCDVCAIDYSEVVAAGETLPHKPKIVSLAPNSLNDVLSDIRRVGEATGQSDKAEMFVRELEHRIAAVRDRAAQSSIRPRVACLEWFDPIYFAGHWVPEMVELAGGDDVLGREGERSDKIAWDKVVELAPDLIVLMPCGYDVQRTLNEVSLLKKREGWRDLPAVATGKVYAVNGHALFSRPGPRLVDGLEILANLIDPEIFPVQVPPDSVQKVA
jgi:iron complex transport system substrate-binding protein